MFLSTKLGLVCFSLCVLSACAKSQYINSAQITTHISGGDEYARLVTNINSSALNLPAIQFPIIDLKNPSLSLGDVSLVPSLDGKSSDLTIDVDLTQVLNLPGAGQNILLPNGTGLPISGIDLTQTMEFNIGGAGSKVYLELDPVKKKAFVGTALVITQFQVGAVLDLFIPFSSNSISGTAGIFTGLSAGQSGVGVFADLSSVFTDGLSEKLALRIPRVQMKAVTSVPYQFLEMNPSNRNEIKIQSMLMKLSVDKQRLNIK